MDFYEVIEKRRSIRSYTDEMVPFDVLKRIVNAARLAPTWANNQGCRYTIVQDEEVVNKLQNAIGQKWCKSAVQFVVVSIKPRRSGTNPSGLQYFPVDAGICMEHIILAATNEGLGTCWIGHFNEDAVKDAINMPKRSRVVAITPIGYTKKTPKREQERKKLEEILYLDKFGDKI